MLIGELRQMFDVVVIDSPPILGLADAVVIASQVDGAVLVMEAGRNYRGNMAAAVERLRKGGTNLLGVVITKYNLRDMGYAQDEQYNYGE